ncbi:hypothetical protein C362_00621 [Cryptococcus neoformans Bt1]|nr:hypothetical protein C362_00621 [Cryptococcus neoformans var. grubii Bt1]
MFPSISTNYIQSLMWWPSVLFLRYVKEICLGD